MDVTGGLADPLCEGAVPHARHTWHEGAARKQKPTADSCGWPMSVGLSGGE